MNNDTSPFSSKAPDYINVPLPAKSAVKSSEAKTATPVKSKRPVPQPRKQQQSQPSSSSIKHSLKSLLPESARHHQVVPIPTSNYKSFRKQQQPQRPPELTTTPTTQQRPAWNDGVKESTPPPIPRRTSTSGTCTPGQQKSNHHRPPLDADLPLPTRAPPPRPIVAPPHLHSGPPRAVSPYHVTEVDQLGRLKLKEEDEEGREGDNR